MFPAGSIAPSAVAMTPNVPRRDLAGVRGGGAGWATRKPTGSPTDRATDARPSAMLVASFHFAFVSSGKPIEADASMTNQVANSDRSSASRMYARSLRASSFQSSCRGSSPWRYSRYSESSGAAPLSRERCVPGSAPNARRRVGQVRPRRESKKDTWRS